MGKRKKVPPSLDIPIVVKSENVIVPIVPSVQIPQQQQQFAREWTPEMIRIFVSLQLAFFNNVPIIMIMMLYASIYDSFDLSTFLFILRCSFFSIFVMFGICYILSTYLSVVGPRIIILSRSLRWILYLIVLIMIILKIHVLIMFKLPMTNGIRKFYTPFYRVFIWIVNGLVTCLIFWILYRSGLLVWPYARRLYDYLNEDW